MFTAKIGFFITLQILILLVSSIMTAQEKRYMFNGGMLFHAGWGRIDSGLEEPDGMTIGLGGRIAWEPITGLRIGGMGFSSSFEYPSPQEGKDSYVRFSYGGATLEYAFNLSTIKIAPGLLTGGGSLQHLHINNGNGDTLNVSYSTTPTLVLMPYLVIEVMLTDSFSLSFMGSWTFGSRVAEGVSYGPALHIGALFNK